MSEVSASPEVQRQILVEQLCGAFDAFVVPKDVSSEEIARAQQEYEDLYEWKRTVVECLSDSIVEELHGHLHVAYKEYAFFKEQRNLEGEFDDGKVLRGEVFERVVQTEFTRDDAVANKLLALMHDPERFLLKKELDHIRNPDLADLEHTGDNKIRITELGECKLGRLNYRAYKQLSKNGLRSSLEAVRDVLSGADLEAIGLGEVAAAGGEIVLDPNLRQAIILPADRNLEDTRSLIAEWDFYRDEDIEAFVELLEDESRTTIRQSAFSTGEIFRMTDVLLAKVRERYPYRTNSENT